jgi:anti-sigma factor RsiW
LEAAVDCREASALLMPLADGELGATAAAALAHHLRRCAGCRGEVATIRELDACVRDAVFGARGTPGLRGPDLLRARLDRALDDARFAPSCLLPPRFRRKRKETRNAPLAAGTAPSWPRWEANRERESGADHDRIAFDQGGARDL